jgi:hypothetical protein
LKKDRAEALIVCLGPELSFLKIKGRVIMPPPS